MVGASQMFPWFGTFDAKKDAVLAISKVKYEQITTTRLQLYTKVKVAYHQLVLTGQKSQIYDELIDRFESLHSVALSKVESGKTSTADALRIELRLEEIKQMKSQLEDERIEHSASISSLTNLPITAIISPIGEIEIPEIDTDPESYLAKVREGYPMFKALDHQIQASEARVAINNKVNAPTVGFGLDYALVNERTDMNPEFNGRDILVPKVMVKIPIYRKQYNAVNKMEALNQESIAYQKDNLGQIVLAQLTQFTTDYNRAKNDIEFYQAQITKINSIYEILLAEYGVNGKGFDELLKIENELLTYSISEQKAKMLMQIAKVNIDKYTDF
jgi:outer membrane protein TolC